MATIDNKIGLKLKGEQKFKKVIETSFEETIKKPAWVKVKVMSYSENYKAVKDALRSNSLKTVCEEASCPNMGECFHHGTASFMIMGDICTRRCVFCDVAFGKPNILSKDEPKSLAKVIKDMNLQYVVITSVDRDDLADGGAKHFVDCITEIRKTSPNTKIEVLTPDFRGRLEIAINILKTNLADVFNHNMETVERLYKSVRPGANFAHSLSLLKKMKNETGITTKSGIMVGLGETDEEVFEIMQEMRTHDIDMITIGQYLQPSKHHINVQRYVTPEQFLKYQEFGEQIGFINVASGVMVRSSYHADLQFSGKQ